MAEKDRKPVDGMNFEEALRELEGVVERLESANVPLEESIDLYERGAALQKHCSEKLKAAELRVSKITAAADGTLSAQSVDMS